MCNREEGVGRNREPVTDDNQAEDKPESVLPVGDRVLGSPRGVSVATHRAEHPEKFKFGGHSCPAGRQPASGGTVSPGGANSPKVTAPRED